MPSSSRIVTAAALMADTLAPNLLNRSGTSLLDRRLAPRISFASRQKLPGFALSPGSRGYGKGNGHTDHQHEAWPDAVIEPQPEPWAVIQLARERRGHRIATEGKEAFGQHAAAHNPEHGETPKDVQLQQPLGGCGRG